MNPAIRHKRPGTPGRPPRKAHRGFSLVELMIALTLGLLVMTAAVALFITNKQVYVTNNGMGQVQDGTRIAFELMARDIRAAGLNGCGDPGRVANVLVNGPNDSSASPAWWADIGNAIIGFDGGTTDPAVATATSSTDSPHRVGTTSSIELVGADGLGVSLASNTPASAKMTLNETSSNLATGSVVIACDPDHAAIMQLTSYTSGSPISLTYASGGSTSPGNCSEGLGFPTSCGTTTGNAYQYAANTQIAALYAADWYVGYNALGGMSLYREALQLSSTNVPTPTAQEMVRNVTGMKILYLTSTGTNFVTAATIGTSQAAWATVIAVQLSLTLQSVSQRAAASPMAGGTGPIIKTLTTTINLRNRVNPP